MQQYDAMRNNFTGFMRCWSRPAPIHSWKHFSPDRRIVVLVCSCAGPFWVAAGSQHGHDNEDAAWRLRAGTVSSSMEMRQRLEHRFLEPCHTGSKIAPYFNCCSFGQRALYCLQVPWSI